MKIKYFIIVLLTFFCVFVVYGEYFAVNYYEVMMESVAYAFIPIILFFLSKNVYKKDIGWSKRIGLVGIMVSTLTVVSLFSIFIRELIRYYF